MSGRRPLRLALAVALLVLGPLAHGESLPLPAPLEALLAALREACPGCVGPGFLPCGGTEIQYGNGFAPNALQGEPPRAYLLARAPTRKEVVAAVLGAKTDAVAGTLAAAFADLRLVVLEAGWQTVRVLAASAAPRIEVDPAQHACFLERPRDLGCCLGDGPADRGCLPKADSPSATLRFEDPAAGETLELRYPMAYEIRLHRRRGGRETLYWCQGWERAPLRGTAPSGPPRGQ
jgi:hypothetical protein